MIHHEVEFSGFLGKRPPLVFRGLEFCGFSSCLYLLAIITTGRLRRGKGGLFIGLSTTSYPRPSKASLRFGTGRNLTMEYGDLQELN
ncbi:uncharacterized protein CTRU02_208624 [Colletotrichum truncatum]|uniref:Uncharacterized protein n=1 Tax=Colletotrichum truncatum TaxID=5467 RepID=A0ACC3YWW0_COLTU|nr:uncharacterized protein CTRU02_15022 [Colletotrichum truncatum]KAF6781517.1 hypothetical protein CTRU02_15022 [Colletotrichum truncatum]